MTEAGPEKPTGDGVAKPAGAMRVAKASAADLRDLKVRLRTLPAKQRLAAILERPDVMRVVRALPVQDVLLTVREIGASDCLELIELLSPRQVQGILDLDAWRKDRIDPGTFADWLELLYAANPDRAVRQVKDLDVELLSLLFKMHTRVYDITEDEHPHDEAKLYSITPDNRYLIAYDDSDEKLAHYLRQTVERLFGVDIPFVLRLIEAVRWEMPSALEEEAFRWRNTRMADLGFLPPGEAQEVFQYLDADKALAEALKQSDAEASRSPSAAAEEVVIGEAADENVRDLSTSVLLPSELFDEGSGVLAAALAQVDERRRARFAHELLMLGNRLHVAIGGDAGDGEALRATVKRAGDTIGIALSYAAKGEPARLGKALVVMHALKLFQVGHSLSVRIARELRARSRAEGSGLDGEGLLRLDSPLRQVAAGLLRAQPLFFTGLADLSRTDYQPFSSLHELAMATKAVGEAAFRAELLVRGLCASDAELHSLGVHDASTGPSHAQLLGTWLAHLLLGEEPSLEPLDDAALRSLQRKLQGSSFRDDDQARALLVLGDVAKELAPLVGAVTPEDAKERASAYARRTLSALAEELASVEGAADGRYIQAAFTTASLAQQSESASNEPEDSEDDA